MEKELTLAQKLMLMENRRQFERIVAKYGIPRLLREFEAELLKEQYSSRLLKFLRGEIALDEYFA